MTVLAYHRADGFSNTDGDGRYAYYEMGGVPTSKFNGTTTVVGGWSGVYGAYVDAYETEIQSPSPCTLDVLVDYDPATLLLKVKATVFAVDDFANARLRYAIAESHLHYHWDALDSLHYVVRKMMPDYYGVGMPAMNPNDTFVDSQSYTLNRRWVDENCYVVVFVQDDSDKSVLRSAKVGSIMPPVYGDANGDGEVTIGDAVFVINYLFRDDVAPDPLASGDSNGDCTVDVVDVVYLINYLFKEGSSPEQGCA